MRPIARLCSVIWRCPMESAIRCETCPMRLKAEENPKSFMSRLWKWHTTWCPGWKQYQQSLAQRNTVPPAGK